MKTKPNKKKKKSEIEIEYIEDEYIESKTPLFGKAMLCLLILYCITIFYFAAIPAESIGSTTIGNYAKLLHVLEFCGFIALSVLTLFAGIEWLDIWRINIIGVLLAASTELVQLISPGRTCSFSDFIFDIIGIISGWVILWILFSLLIMYLISMITEECARCH